MSKISPQTGAVQSNLFVLQMASKWLTFVLILILHAYLLLGAVIFGALERNNELATIEQLKELRENITSILHSLNCSNSSALADPIDRLLNYFHLDEIITSKPKWDFEGSLFFSYATVTTVGYGLAPVTVAGRLIFVLYALLGIPLCITVLHQVAAYSHRCAIWCSVGTALRRHRICVGVGYVIVGVLLIVVPSILIAVEENWAYLDSVYYVFSTLFTVGYGDLVASRKQSSLPQYRIFLSVWILFGITYMASLIKFINGLDTKLVQYFYRKVYIKTHGKNEPKSANGQQTGGNSQIAPVQ